MEKTNIHLIHSMIDTEFGILKCGVCSFFFWCFDLLCLKCMLLFLSEDY
jgi:hypothetical protein